MHAQQNPAEAIGQSRREFLTSAASGLGMAALAATLAGDGVLGPHGAQAGELLHTDPLAAKPPHIAPRAKACIFIFMEGAPSQIDLFDPKPKLNELHGRSCPNR